MNEIKEKQIELDEKIINENNYINKINTLHKEIENINLINGKLESLNTNEIDNLKDEIKELKSKLSNEKEK